MAFHLAGSLNTEKGIALINLKEEERELEITDPKRFSARFYFRLANDENDETGLDGD
jgi:hypothetical protein